MAKERPRFTSFHHTQRELRGERGIFASLQDLPTNSSTDDGGDDDGEARKKRKVTGKSRARKSSLFRRQQTIDVIPASKIPLHVSRL